nr:hypothetical protein [Tanacetum cinerariifolium]
SLGCQESIGDTIAQTRFENVSKLSNDSLLTRGNTLQSDKDRLKLDELMALCTTLQNRFLDLEKTKTTQDNEISTRVESFDNKESLGEDASKQGSIDEDEEITLVNVQNVDEEMFDVNVLDGEEVFVAEQEVATNKENDEVNVVEEVVEVINTAKKLLMLLELVLLGKKFEDFRTELVEGREKRAGIKLIQENTKKQKVEDDKETSELKQCLEIILDKEKVTIDDIPLAVKSSSIVD